MLTWLFIVRKAYLHAAPRACPFVSGDFEGDVHDDVSELEAEACLGLVGWLDFYYKVGDQCNTADCRWNCWVAACMVLRSSGQHS